MLVSIIIPAYKKELTIKQDILNIHTVMAQTRWQFELIVVVDGFVDNTFTEAQTITHPNVFICGYKSNRGKGYAVRYGMSRARGDYVAFIDAGLEINPNGMSMLLEHMEWYSADVVVASKRHPASRVNYSRLRKIYSWGYYLCVKVLFGLKVTDTQTGLKVFRREVLEHVLPRLLVKEFALDIELLSVANHLGFTRIFDAPVELELDFSPDSKFSKLKPFFLDPFVLGMLIDTLAIFYRMHILRYYDDSSRRKWIYDAELQMNLNTGELLFDEISNTLVPETAKALETLKFSVIIPVRGVNAFLKENIAQLKQLQYQNFEVLIILDELEHVDFGGDARFKVYAVGPKGPGEKRNFGAMYSSGDVLAFLDDDAYPSPTWLTEAAKVFTQEKPYAIGAPAVTPLNAPVLEKSSGRVLESFLASFTTVYRHIPSESRYIDDYPTVNLLVTKQAFSAVGGFDTRFWPGEDTKLCLDLVKNFGKFLYDPRPVVYHHRRTLFTPHLKQISRYGRHRGHFARIFPDNSRLVSYFIPSLFVLGLTLGPSVVFVKPLFAVYIATLHLYLFLVLFSTFKVFLQDKSFSIAVLTGVGIVLTHLVYGFNFIVGFFKRPALELKKIDLVSKNYIEG